MARLKSVCPSCGDVFDRDDSAAARCPACQPKRRRESVRPWRGTSTERGYDAAWRRLSRRARHIQPWCSDCGSPDDLTADHSPAAWQRRDAGKRIRLEDIDVVCRPCNQNRGAARGPDAADRPTFADQLDQLDRLDADLDQLDADD